MLVILQTAGLDVGDGVRVGVNSSFIALFSFVFFFLKLTLTTQHRRERGALEVQCGSHSYPSQGV